MGYPMTKKYGGKTWIVLVSILMLFCIVSPIDARYLMLEKFNGTDSWIVGTASGPRTTGVDVKYNGQLPDDVVKDVDESDTAYRYVDGEIISDTTGAINPPSSNEAFKKIQEYFIAQKGSDTAGLDKMDSVLSASPTLERSIASERYKLAINRFRVLEKQGTITKSTLNYLVDLLKGRK